MKEHLGRRRIAMVADAYGPRLEVIPGTDKMGIGTCEDGFCTLVPLTIDTARDFHRRLGDLIACYDTPTDQAPEETNA